jgi:ABC-type transporter Mla subunit MlaD
MLKLTQQLKTYFKNGIMKKVVIILCVFFLLSCNNNTKKIYVIFDNVETLEPNSKVTCKGIEIGKIDKIDLYGDKVLVELTMKDKYKITKESKFLINQSSLLGSGNIEVIVNIKNVELIRNNDTLIGANTKNDIHKLIELLKKDN